ncbi:MAG: formyltetrahydrofolate deformylase, partial [Bacteroidota bacterium]
MSRQILLVDCPDAPGLIYRITGALFDRQCNIIRNQEFVDPDNRQFFMRSEFIGDVEEGELLSDLRRMLPASSHVRLATAGDREIVLMVTKEHHCLGELLLRNAFHELGATVKAVVSNHDVLRSFVERFEIPFHHIPTDGLSREQHEEEVAVVLDQYAPEYVVLAKYMRILTSGFVARYSRRIINIHHSFLPAFVGAQPYRQAFERGVKIIGATAHFVTEGLD